MFDLKVVVLRNNKPPFNLPFVPKTASVFNKLSYSWVKGLV